MAYLDRIARRASGSLLHLPAAILEAKGGVAGGWSTHKSALVARRAKMLSLK
jgi:hypothetical protein